MLCLSMSIKDVVGAGEIAQRAKVSAMPKVNGENKFLKVVL